MGMILEIFFFFFSNADVKFAELEKLIWKTYTAVEALSTTSWIKLISKRKFAKTALDKNFEIFIVHISALKAMTIYPS